MLTPRAVQLITTESSSTLFAVLLKNESIACYSKIAFFKFTDNLMFIHSFIIYFMIGDQDNFMEMSPSQKIVAARGDLFNILYIFPITLDPCCSVKPGLALEIDETIKSYFFFNSLNLAVLTA